MVLKQPLHRPTPAPIAYQASANSVQQAIRRRRHLLEQLQDLREHGPSLQIATALARQALAGDANYLAACTLLDEPQRIALDAVAEAGIMDLLGIDAGETGDP